MFVRRRRHGRGEEREDLRLKGDRPHAEAARTAPRVKNTPVFTHAEASRRRQVDAATVRPDARCRPPRAPYRDAVGASIDRTRSLQAAGAALKDYLDPEGGGQTFARAVYSKEVVDSLDRRGANACGASCTLAIAGCCNWLLRGVAMVDARAWFDDDLSDPRSRSDDLLPWLSSCSSTP